MGALYSCPLVPINADRHNNKNRIVSKGSVFLIRWCPQKVQSERWEMQEMYRRKKWNLCVPLSTLSSSRMQHRRTLLSCHGCLQNDRKQPACTSALYKQPVHVLRAFVESIQHHLYCPLGLSNCLSRLSSIAIVLQKNPMLLVKHQKFRTYHIVMWCGGEVNKWLICYW